MERDEILGLLVATAEAVRQEITPLVHRYLARPDPSPAAADEADAIAERVALDVLRRRDVRVLSESAGWIGDAKAEVEVVLDPIDGTNNLVRGIPYSGPSIFAIDRAGHQAAVVLNAFTGHTFWAASGAGAFRDGEHLVAPVEPAGDAIVGGAPDVVAGIWARDLGATAHALCAVAEGRLDGYRTPVDRPDRSWDLLAGALIAGEAGCEVAASDGGDIAACDRLAEAWIVVGRGQIFSRLRKDSSCRIQETVVS